jgi:hypothetical protein
VTLAVPENVPLEPAALKTPIVRWALSRERFSAGGALPLNVTTGQEELVNEGSKMSRYSYRQPVIRMNSNQLPIRVTSSFPETSNKLTRNTELVINRSEEMKAKNYGNNNEWAEEDQLRPTVEVGSEVGFGTNMTAPLEDADIKDML